MNIIKFFLIISLCHLGIMAFSQKMADRKTNKGVKTYQIGSKVSDFELKNVDGEMISLNSFENAKGYIVIFTSNLCPFAVAYEDRIIELHNDMESKGYPVIAINSNDASMEKGDSFEAMVQRHKDKNFPFVYLKDEQSLFKKFGANKTPHVFLLDSELVLRYIGAIDDNAKEPEMVQEKFLENAISALENGETPNPETTKAVGCPIKSKDSKNKDGRRKGPPSPEKTMERMDANNDGQISKSEAKGPLSKDFDKFDINKDGFLTLAELAKKPKRRN